MQDLQAEPEDVLLARVAFGEGRSDSPDWVADSVMVRAKENYLGLDENALSTIRDQILPNYDPKTDTGQAPYQVFWVVIGYETIADAKGKGTFDDMEETMDPTYDYPNDPQSGIGAFMQVYAMVEPMYEAVMICNKIDQLPDRFRGEWALDSFGAAVPSWVDPEYAAHAHLSPGGKQTFYPSGEGELRWSW
jgi:hypothetical protein